MIFYRYVLWERMADYELIGWTFAFPVSVWACCMVWPCDCRMVEPVS